MKILVMGAGAIGSAIGGYLQKNNNDITLIGRAEHINAIKENGLRITGIWGEHIVKGFALYTDANEIKDTFDVILITVKSYDTERAVNSVYKLLKEDGFILSVQNGLGNYEIIKNIVGEKRTVAARVIFGVVKKVPGEIEITVFADAIRIGIPYLKTLSFNDARHLINRVKDFVEILNATSIPTEYTTDIIAYLWAKLLYNAALNPLSAILDVPYGILSEDSSTRLIMDQIVKEIFEVAKAQGVKMFWQRPESFLKEFYEKLIPATYEHESSMLQDIRNKRPTEIDAMNGKICQLGKDLSVPTPYNETITQLVKFKEFLNNKE